MYDLFTAFLIVFIVWLTGLPVFLMKHLGITGKIGLSFLIGTALSTFTVFASYFVLFHRFSLFQVLCTLIGIILIEFVLIRIVRPMFLPDLIQSLKSWIFSIVLALKSRTPESLIVYFLMAVMLFSFSTNFIQPIFDWDALALYDFRAKVIVDLGTLSESNPFFYFYQYPPYTSLLHAFIYFTGSFYSKIWYTLIFASLLMCSYSLLRLEHGKVTSLIVCCLMATTPMLFVHSFMAYTNLPYTVLFVIGILMLVKWIQYDYVEFLLVGAILVGFSQWVRSAEPFWIIGVFLIIIGGFTNTKRLKYVVFSLLILISLHFPWNMFVEGVIHPNTISQNRESAISMPFDPQTFFIQTKEALLFLYSAALTQQLLPLSLLFISGMFLILNQKFRHILTHAAVIIVLISFMIGMVIFTYTFVGWRDIPDSAARLSMILLPLLIFVAMPSMENDRKKLS